ncbi:multidrug transporter [Acidiferrobacter sp. SPIII_3]|uniref:HlyD family secretion protein n=1 Tax=Acidiferrobacter sp. SPIII_3 TaxID=1281578 RepID=UPI000D7304BD|nr:HlyD family secretion protein [Acidiferrobacter sp. SPIII_3]AWP23596.1 multidrug transporter [Acidiferrobacter sp. SPIII_3]
MGRPAEGKARAPGRRGTRARWAMALIGLAVVGLFLYWALYARFYAGTDDAYVTGDLVPVDAQVTGTAAEVFVRRTQFVRKGERLAVLQADRSHLGLRRARAALGREARHVRVLFARVRALRWQRQALGWDRARLVHDLARYQRSLSEGAVSAMRVEDTQLRIRALNAEIGETRARWEGARALVRGTTVADNPLVRVAIARLEAADLAWQRRVIRAPVSGFIGQRTVYPGTEIHAGQRLFTIVPLDDLWVMANIKETHMRDVRPGDRVRLTSAYYGSDVVYRGVVLGLAPGAGSAFSILPPDNATGNYIHIVERVPVRIGLKPSQLAAHPLRPGLSMAVRVRVHRRGRSLLMPLTTRTGSHYQTRIYRQELRRAQALAAHILARSGKDLAGTEASTGDGHASGARTASAVRAVPARRPRGTPVHGARQIR